MTGGAVTSDPASVTMAMMEGTEALDPESVLMRLIYTQPQLPQELKNTCRGVSKKIFP